jgi:hypothetical protein
MARSTHPCYKLATSLRGSWGLTGGKDAFNADGDRTGPIKNRNVIGHSPNQIITFNATAQILNAFARVIWRGIGELKSEAPNTGPGHLRKQLISLQNLVAGAHNHLYRTRFRSKRPKRLG